MDKKKQEFVKIGYMDAHIIFSQLENFYSRNEYHSLSIVIHSLVKSLENTTKMDSTVESMCIFALLESAEFCESEEQEEMANMFYDLIELVKRYNKQF